MRVLRSKAKLDSLRDELMFTIQICTNRSPFYEVKREAAVIVRVVRGERPQRPLDASAAFLSDGVWNMIECCWAQNKKSRPRIEEIVGHLVHHADCSDWPWSCTQGVNHA
jgi:hypothetical protein